MDRVAYIRGSEGKLDFMEWILFHFYRRLLNGVLPRQYKNTAEVIPTKKAKGSREKKKTHFRFVPAETVELKQQQGTDKRSCL